MLVVSGMIAMPPSQHLGLRAVKVGPHDLRVEVADTEASRRRGMMFRLREPPDAGMLFVFPRKQPVCLWMKYTFIPLTVAFVGDDGVIVGMAAMAPLSLHRHCAEQPVRFALEVPTAWFEAKAIGVGTRISGLPETIGMPAP